MSRSARTLVIAEAGVNHCGSLDRALALVDAAAEVGADIVKFQTFNSADLVTPASRKADYQRASTSGSDDQLAMLAGLELSFADFARVAERCRERGIEFLSTAFDAASLEFLVTELGISRIKIPSGDLTNGPLLLAAARHGLPMIVSTGMATLDEIRAALGVIASADDLRELRDSVVLLHCVTAYPTPAAAANLRAMDTMRSEFGLEVGFSDHTEGISVAIAAVARGASVIEKHLTIDKALPGPDHSASLEPGEFAAMVDAIHAVETSVGDGDKVPSPAEVENIIPARRSLVALQAIQAGEPFTESNLGAKRPGSGVSPMEFWNLLGTMSPRAYEPDELIEP